MSLTLTKEQQEKVYEVLKDDDVRNKIISLKTPQNIVKFVGYSLSKIEITASPADLKKYLYSEIANLLDIKSEVKRFFEELPDECKAVAITLSLFNGVSEPDFWYVYQNLIPEEDVKPVDKEEKPKHVSPFASPKYKLLDKVRASVESTKARTDIGESILTQVKFVDSRYASEILNYVKSNHPEFLEKIMPNLLMLLTQSSHNLVHRVAIANALGAIARINWPAIRNFVEDCANQDYPAFRAIPGHIFEAAIRDELINNNIGNLLLRWSNFNIDENSWKLLWTAASSFKQIGQINIQFALTGLERIVSKIDVRRQELSVVRVFEAVKYAMVVLALTGNLAYIINALHNWINNSDQDDGGLSKLTISLLWLHIAGVYSNFAHENKSQNEILTLISQDEEIFKSLFQLKASVFTTLHRIKIDDKPMSRLVLFIAEDWIISSDEKSVSVVVEVMKHVRSNLKQAHKKYYEHFTGYLKKIWLAPRQEQAIKSAAKLILKG